MRWARANFLLTWNGGPSALVFAPTPEAQDPWANDWTTDVGRPLAPAVAADEIWSRRFSDGLVLVNRSAAPKVVPLGGTYALPDGRPANVATVEGHGGLVLRAIEVPSPRCVDQPRREARPQGGAAPLARFDLDARRPLPKRSSARADRERRRAARSPRARGVPRLRRAHALLLALRSGPSRASGPRARRRRAESLGPCARARARRAPRPRSPPGTRPRRPGCRSRRPRSRRLDSRAGARARGPRG